MSYFKAFRKKSFKLTVLTGASLVSCLTVAELPAFAATFANSTASIRLDEFSFAPQNPDANSDRDALALVGLDNSAIDADGDGTLTFVNDADPFIDLDFTSSVLGDGTDYFGLGVSSSSAVSTFFVPENETLSFDFAVSLALESELDEPTAESINNFTQASFALFDNATDIFLGEFIANGNLDTGVIGADNDGIGAVSNLNLLIDSFAEVQPISGDFENASLDIIGSLQQTFTTATEVRLEVNTFNRSCSQAPAAANPCLIPDRLIAAEPVPEHNGILGLILGVVGYGFFWQKRSQSLK